jgi:hypothetical protein
MAKGVPAAIPQAPATTTTAMAEGTSRVTRKVKTAEASAKYTRYPAKRSATFWTGARDASARSTASTMRPNTVSRPQLAVRTSSAPDWLIVPAKT